MLESKARRESFVFFFFNDLLVEGCFFGLRVSLEGMLVSRGWMVSFFGF